MTTREELKVRALLETISSLYDSLADLRVEVTVLSSTVDSLQRENDELKEKYEDGSVSEEAPARAASD